MSDCMVHYYLCDYIVVLHILIYTPMIVPHCKPIPCKFACKKIPACKMTDFTYLARRTKMQRAR